jgi:hypothetical protein
MPKFTLIKHADSDYDSNVTVTFTAEVLDLARAHYEDFLRASGFETELVDSSAEMYSEWLEKAEDAMWDEAFDFKFKENDGPVGATGADILPFPVTDK